MDICEEYLPYDVTMFWEFFRWERWKKGHIYLQQFPNGKLYAGQTTQFTDRMNKYSNHYGSNPHHTNALNLYGWSNVCVLSIECPVYMLDTIEIFLISYYNLMNPDNGYNKTSGGRKNWYVSKETRAKISKAISGERNGFFGKTHTSNALQKISIANTGRNMSKDFCIRARERAKGNNYAIINAGIPKTLEHRERIRAYWTAEKRNERSGSKSIFSKPICAFGTLYPSSQDATNALYNTYKLKKKNFVSNWISRGTHANDVFKIHKEFYTYAITCELENITKDFYTTFMEICLW
ncbi:GIY-YIG catalytic domain-containing endonuclease [Paramecium bursaria Chlorella virus NW665.2]|nr:GIY-YIG catalytic domain-containing endonuclease [Paramecium bursaria Chlorella virus NW665.2]